MPVLTDVYYVQSNVNQETKAVSNVLVKRGKEWHGPDRMIVSDKSIVFVEPVEPDSQVARMIAESKKVAPLTSPVHRRERSQSRAWHRRRYWPARRLSASWSRGSYWRSSTGFECLPRP